MRHLYKYSFIILAILLLSGSCKKDKTKEPVGVDVVMAMYPEFNGAGDLAFQEGSITIEKIKIEATREVGDPIIYARSFEDQGGLSVKMDGSSVVDQLKFDFPVGNYTSINMDVSIDDDENMELRGTYEPPNSNDVYRIQFLLDEEFTFELENTDIVEMDPDKSVQLTIELNPLSWFRTVVAQAFISASVYSVDNQQTVVISSDKNTNIYNKVTKRLDKENRLLFQ